MQTAQDFIFVSSNAVLEERVCLLMTSFKERAEEISTRQINNEADIRALKIDTDTLISDLQAFSNSIPEGTRLDHNLGYVRNPIGFEKGIGTAAA